LGPEGKGIYVLFTTNYELIILLVGFSLPSALTYFISRNALHKQEITSLMVYSLMLILPLMTILLAIEPLRDNILPGPLNTGRGIALFYAYIIFSFLKGNVVGILSGQKKFRYVNIMNITFNVLSLIGFAFIYLFNITFSGLSKVEMVLLIFMAFHILFIYVYFRMIRSLLDFKNIFSFEILKKSVRQTLNYVMYYHLATLMNFFNYRLAYWFISAYENETQLGLYSLALNLCLMTRMLSQSISVVSVPFLSSEKLKNSLEITLSISRLMAWFTFAFNAFLFLIAEKLIGILYSPEFAPSVAMFRIMIVGVSFYILAAPLTTILLSRGITKVQFIISSIASILGFVLYYIFTPIYGVTGVAWITAFVFVLIYVMFLVYCKQKFKISLLEIYVLKKSDLLKVVSLFKRRQYIDDEKKE